MSRYLYCYQTTVRFDTPITSHAIMLRCQPSQCAFQKIEQEQFLLSPQFWMRSASDVFGNRILFGGTRQRHASLAYVSSGIVSVGDYVEPDASPAPYYKYPTAFTRVSQSFDIPQGDSLDMAMAICHKVNALIAYEPGTTDTTTTAQEVMHHKRGVCQDYAHVMIALCRECAIPARYVCGFLEGVGATHAWVEIHDGRSWRAIDPTNDVLIESGYIKLAHGRDASDCPVNRGTYQGCASLDTYFNVTVTQTE